MPKNVTLTSGLTVRLRRVKAKTVLGGAPSSPPLLYQDRAGVVQYGTLWNRPDKGGLVFADRAQVRLGRDKGRRPKKGEDGYDAHLQAEQLRADRALQTVDPDAYVWVTTDPAQVRLHPDAKVCGGSSGKSAHPEHLKVIYPNPSRNPWCNDWARDLAAREVEEDEEEVALPTPVHVTVARRKAIREAVRRTPTVAERMALVAKYRREHAASA